MSQKQYKFQLSDEMRAELDRAAAEQGHAVSDEIRARINAFREEHRLVPTTVWVPKGKSA